MIQLEFNFFEKRIYVVASMSREREEDFYNQSINRFPPSAPVSRGYSLED